MIDAITSGSFASDIPFVVMLLLKVTVVLCTGAGIAFALRNSAASVRHTVWALTLAGTVALPLGMLVSPAWRVGVLPAISSRTPSPGNEDMRGPGITDDSRAIASAAGNQIGATVGNGALSSASSTELALRQRSTAASRLRNAIDFVVSAPAVLILGIWLAGVILFLGRMMLGRIALARIVSRAEPLDTSDWIRVLAREAQRTSIEPRVRIVASAEVSSPLMTGSRFPVILLPEEARDWTDEHRAVVIRHEMVHIASRDTIVCLVAGIACALYWFHPLVWMANRQLKKEQERACDDRVLDLGTPAADYASHLLEVARSARNLGMQSFVSVAMARPSQLEGRLLAVLSDSRSHAVITSRRRVVAVVTALAMLSAISAFEPVAASTVITSTSGASSFASSSMKTTSVAAVPVKPPASIIIAGQFDGGIVAPAASSPTITDRAGDVVKGAMKSAVNEAVDQLERAADSTAAGEVAVSRGGTLELDLRTGASLDIVGWDESKVRMHATLGGRDWRDSRIRINGDGQNARIETRYDEERGSHSSSHRIEIRVPRRFNIRVSSAGGAIKIRDVEGRFTGTTGGGDIRIERARGHADLRTGGGSVDVSNSSLSGSVGTGGGAVLIQGVTGGLTGHSGTGNVIYGVAGGVTYSGEGRGGVRTASDGSTHVRKSGGSITVASAPDGADLRTGGGAITIGSAGGRVYATTGGGKVDIARLRGSAEVHTGAGDVTITLTDDSGPLEITSGFGTVTLIVPSALRANLDLETAYTRNRRNPTAIESDFALATSETRDWDSTYGTPRRYVRARQSIGGGGPLIRVRTVNGNIRIRRN
ncbi:MAG TPA: M56 family metallopeptidase [Gemmatimonadaceae bacterium]|nr:M56 family metallopeptidase [Gemmatimonadaceae bacterium]